MIAVNKREKQYYTEQVKERLVFEFTMNGRGIMVGYDLELDVTVMSPSGRPVNGLVMAVGEPAWNSRDGGHYAEAWRFFSIERLPEWWGGGPGALDAWKTYVLAASEAYDQAFSAVVS